MHCSAAKLRILCLFGVIFLAGCEDSQTSQRERFYLPREGEASSYQKSENQQQVTRTSSAAAKQQVNDPMEKRVDISAFSPAMPFGDAIDVLRANEPGMNIVVLWRNLEENGIARNQPIGIDPVSGFTFRQSLDALLSAISPRGPKLAYEVDGNVIIIATKNALPQHVTTKVYGTGDVSSSPADFHTNLDELNRNNPSSPSPVKIPASP
jgi:hypothetical protein